MKLSKAELKSSKFKILEKSTDVIILRRQLWPHGRDRFWGRIRGQILEANS